MPYTLWSKGRLLGHTDLGFIANTDCTKMGWFHPTEVGEQILEVITEPSRLMQSYRRDVDVDALTTDLAAATSRVEGLDLELRSPEGAVMKTEDISINDTERLLALAEAEQELEEQSEYDFMSTLDELADDLDVDDLEVLEFEDTLGSSGDFPWEESTLPRYQILVFM